VSILAMNFKNYIMKYLFVFLLVGLVSCGDASADATGEVTKEKQADDTGDASKDVTKEKQADKYSTVKIGNLEIMTKDLGKKGWDDAMKACTDLGDGWRLPTKDELNLLFENREKIGGFANFGYWSSTEYGNGYAWGQGFGSGNQGGNNKGNGAYVRSVRAF
tara:strand:- start:156 stop:641 length:486 start_codon:yes stop_codon:yes gene_type:complete